MQETIQAYDEWLIDLINYEGSAFADSFWYLFTDKFCWSAAALALLACVVVRCRNWRCALLTVTAFAVLAFLTDYVAAQWLRPLFARPRPSHTEGLSQLLHYVNGYHGGQYGFFSNHASNSFGVATLIALLFRRRWATAAGFAWAACLCYSRMYLGVHFPGDILAGAFWGAMAALGVFYAYKALYARAAERWNWNSMRATFHDPGEPWLITGTIAATTLVIFFIALISTCC